MVHDHRVGQEHLIMVQDLQTHQDLVGIVDLQMPQDLRVHHVQEVIVVRHRLHQDLLVLQEEQVHVAHRVEVQELQEVGVHAEEEEDNIVSSN